MRRTKTEEAEHKMEPRSFTAFLSPLTVELIDKKGRKLGSIPGLFLGRNCCVFRLGLLWHKGRYSSADMS